MSYPENWEKEVIDIIPIEADYIVIQPVIGEKYHLSWAKSKGMVWKLIDIIETQCLLQTPKTKRTITSDVSTLRHLNKNARLIAKQRRRNEKNQTKD